MRRFIFLLFGAAIGLSISLFFQYSLGQVLENAAVSKENVTLIKRILIEPVKIGAPLPTSVQLYMWIAFFVALSDILWRIRRASRIEQQSSSCMSVLLTERSHLWTDDNLSTAWHKIVDRGSDDLVADWCREVIRKYQIGGSLDQCVVVLRSKYESVLEHIDHDYMLIRYINWLLPTLGFIGTVIGIAFAMEELSKLDILTMDQSQLSVVLTKLGTAFYTTLVGLALSVVLLFVSQKSEEVEERRVQRYFRFCEDEFLSKLHAGSGK